jgi:hypothetical protein
MPTLPEWEIKGLFVVFFWTRTLVGWSMPPFYEPKNVNPFLFCAKKFNQILLDFCTTISFYYFKVFCSIFLILQFLARNLRTSSKLTTVKNRKKD